MQEISPDFILFHIPREDVEACDLDYALKTLSSLLSSREIVLNSCGILSLFFAGYDDDPRALYHISDVREYVMALDRKFPYWYYFADHEGATLQLLALCLCRIVTDYKHSTPQIDDLRRLSKHHLEALDSLCSTFGIPENVKNDCVAKSLALLFPGSAP
jgi:hypothetical protein